MEVAKNQVDEIEDLYREEYFNTILGYYLPFEIYTNASGFSHNWAIMFNTLIEHLNLKVFNIPILFSPFLSDYAGSSQENIKDTFDILFKEASFREFDLVIPMDSYGNVLPNDLNNERRAFNYLEIIRKSIQENSRIDMAVNIEIFSEVKDEFLIAEFERIKQQLNLAYSFNNKKIISFSFSHHIIFDGNEDLI